MNKSLTPQKKTNPIHRTPNSHQRSTTTRSPVKKQHLPEVNIEERLRRNREKLTHTLDTYTMLIRSNNQIRCLQHNSVVSIFCETENKLLCTNCVFGKIEHKFHKISPIDKCYQKIEESIEKMKPVIEKEIVMLSNIKEIVLGNLDEEIVNFEKGMERLTIHYATAHQLLQDNFLRAKNKLIKLCQEIKLKHQTVALELNFLSDLYDVKLPMINLDFAKLETNDILVYHHSLLHTLASQRKFEGNVWNVPRNEVHRTCMDEERRIGKVCDQLAGFLAEIRNI